MTIHEAYKAFGEADEAWSADLKRTFGKRAGDVRYTVLGRTHPNCAASYARFRAANDTWLALVQETFIYKMKKENDHDPDQVAAH